MHALEQCCRMMMMTMGIPRSVKPYYVSLANDNTTVTLYLKSETSVTLQVAVTDDL